MMYVYCSYKTLPNIGFGGLVNITGLCHGGQAMPGCGMKEEKWNIGFLDIQGFWH